jgi:L-cysteine desulfidase
MKKFTMLFLTLAVATANMPAAAMMANLKSVLGKRTVVREQPELDRALDGLDNALDNQIVAANKSKAQVLKYAAAGTATAITTGAAVAAALAYMYPEATCEQIANYCANSGAMVCNQAMTTCAPYLVKPELTFWQQILAYLGF